MPRVHHLNCGTMRLPMEVLTEGKGSFFRRGELVCHCLLVETERSGLVLVDAGFGSRECRRPLRFPWSVAARLGVPLDPAETAIARVRALGYAPEDVRHIVLTHMDLDHAGGLPDFPWAEVHVSAAEREEAVRRARQVRYAPSHWAHGPRWAADEEGSEVWRGFVASPLRGLGGQVLLVSLPGHSAGHCGVAVREGQRWLLHAGDAYASRHEVKEDPPWCPLGHRAFHEWIAVDHGARRRTISRLRALFRTHQDEVDLFCAHDAGEFPRDHADSCDIRATRQVVPTTSEKSAATQNTDPNVHGDSTV